MKIKTGELIGAKLDWAVAIAEGLHPLPPSSEPHSSCVVMAYPDEPVGGQGRYLYKPSRRWDFGGPIIERNDFKIEKSTYSWFAGIREKSSGWNARYDMFDGDTALVAAMRAYVARKLGDEVEVPEATS